MDTISLLIVDDHSLFREGLRAVLERQDGIAVLGEAGDAETGVRLAVELWPDVVLMDLHMPGRSGVEAISEIVRRRPDARIIALSMYEDPDLVDRVVLAGARGYLLKDERVGSLVERIRTVAQGGVAIDPHIGARLLNEYRRLALQAAPPRPTHPLTPREVAVLDHLARGLSNREIANQLYLSEQTIKNLLTGIYDKLGVRNRRDAIGEAVRQRIIAPRT